MQKNGSARKITCAGVANIQASAARIGNTLKVTDTGWLCGTRLVKAFTIIGPPINFSGDGITTYRIAAGGRIPHLVLTHARVFAPSLTNEPLIRGIATMDDTPHWHVRFEIERSQNRIVRATIVIVHCNEDKGSDIFASPAGEDWHSQAISLDGDDLLVLLSGAVPIAEPPSTGRLQKC